MNLSLVSTLLLATTTVLATNLRGRAHTASPYSCLCSNPARPRFVGTNPIPGWANCETVFHVDKICSKPAANQDKARSACCTTSTISYPAAPAPSFPAHWGNPPKFQTRDFARLPGGYGYGSSTVAKWIQQNLDIDNTATTPRGQCSRHEIAKVINTVHKRSEYLIGETGEVVSDLRFRGCGGCNRGCYSVKLSSWGKQTFCEEHLRCGRLPTPPVSVGDQWYPGEKVQVKGVRKSKSNNLIGRTGKVVAKGRGCFCNGHRECYKVELEPAVTRFAPACVGRCPPPRLDYKMFCAFDLDYAFF